MTDFDSFYYTRFQSFINTLFQFSRNCYCPVLSMPKSGLFLHPLLGMDSISYGQVAGWLAFLLMTKGLVMNGMMTCYTCIHIYVCFLVFLYLCMCILYAFMYVQFCTYVCLYVNTWIIKYCVFKELLLNFLIF
jgi:hypothetical protein